MVERTKPDDRLPPSPEDATLRISAVAPVVKPAARRPAVCVDVVDEDAALVDAARGGDQAAFARLFERHHGRVYAMCSRLLRDPAEVEDAVQQAFLEAWRSLYRFEGRSRFSTWITRIAIHTCLGFRRRLKRLFFATDTAPAGGEGPSVWAESPITPDDGAAERERRRALDDVLARLSVKKRVVLVLADLEGMTAPEISRVLDIPDATVRTRLFHARKDLAKLLREHPHFQESFRERVAEDAP